MQNYVLHPGLTTFWVDLQRDRLKELEPRGKVVLDNQNYGTYEIPFSEISKYFQLDDMTIYKRTMRLTSPATQPHFFTIQAKRILSNARRENTTLVNDFDAHEYFISDRQKLTVQEEEPAVLVTSTEQKIDDEELDTSSQFEMENELEGFMAQNWNSIFPDWEKLGRQVPAGNVGRIDFLGKNKKNGTFRVWELKRGETDDVALGQLLRYMGHVSATMAGSDKTKVSGEIVCLKQGEGLKMAVTQLDGRVSVMEYEVRFNLRPAVKA